MDMPRRTAGEWVQTICDLILVNILWLICSLPIITIGASTAALHSVVRKMAACEYYTVWSGFWHGFHENWKQGTSAAAENSTEKRAAAEPCQPPDCTGRTGLSRPFPRSGLAEYQSADHCRSRRAAAWRRPSGTNPAASFAESLRPAGGRTDNIGVNLISNSPVRKKPGSIFCVIPSKILDTCDQYIHIPRVSGHNRCA